MCELLVEPSGGGETGGIVNHAPAEPSAGAVEVVVARPGRVELRVPGELRAVSAAEKLISLAVSGIPSWARAAIAIAFRETLENAIEHGCRHDASKRVEVSFVRRERAVVCRVRDPGEGFDPGRLEHAAVNNPDDDPLRHARVREEKGMRGGGFGMLLAASVVDELVYNERHNEVTFVKNLF